MPELDSGMPEGPEGFPFILVDKVLAAVAGERAIGIRNVTANDPLLASGGGRPGPMRRGLLIEAFSQLASRALAGEGAKPVPVEIAKIDSMRFVRSPVSGDQLVLTVVISKGDGEADAEGAPVRASCKAEAGGELLAEGEIEFEPPAGAEPG